ncbi:hypothetical protein MNBD_NITROSPINAE01-1719 [hydrothermal vent metagenome]|uniref:Zinc ABC transporter, substrate-binding protein ZnuA n=1 Tax=hydrothermal vent metagenome TaxID=652676 RepID=A0A3B1C4W7_9ZZZZ
MLFRKFFFTGCAVIFFAFPAFSEPLNVTVTIHPVADIVKKIGGDAIEVHTLLKPGDGPHTFEPAPSDMKAIGRANMIVTVGFGLDMWLEKLLATSRNKGNVVDLSTIVKNPIDIARDNDGHHHKGHINPHYWLDPIIMKKAVGLIERELLRLLPEEASKISKNARAVMGELDRLDKEIKTLLGTIDHLRPFIAFHNSWSYFARRYGLKEAGVLETSPGREPSAKHFRNLLRQIKKSGVKAVLTEPQFSSRLAKTLAKEAGVAVVTVDPIGGVAGRDGYFELMRYNAKKFAGAIMGT